MVWSALGKTGKSLASQFAEELSKRIPLGINTQPAKQVGVEVVERVPAQLQSGSSFLRSNPNPLGISNAGTGEIVRTGTGTLTRQAQTSGSLVAGSRSASISPRSVRDALKIGGGLIDLISGGLGTQTGTQTGLQTGLQTQTGTQTGLQTQTGTQTGLQTGLQTQTGTQTGLQTGLQTGTQTGTQAITLPNPQGKLFEPLQGSGQARGTVQSGKLKLESEQLTKPKSLLEIEEAGVNGITPMIKYLKILDGLLGKDIEELKKESKELKLLLQNSNQLTDLGLQKNKLELEKSILELGKQTQDTLFPLLKLVSLTNTAISEIPDINIQTLTSVLIPIVGGISLLFDAVTGSFNGIANGLSNMRLDTAIQLPSALGLGLALPTGLNLGVQIPQALALGVAIPQALNLSAAIPQSLTLTGSQTSDLSQQLNLLSSYLNNLSGLTSQNLEQLLAQLEVIQGLVTSSQLSTQLSALQKSVRDFQKTSEKCCKQIQASLNQQISGSGEIECGSIVDKFSYSGPGLLGLKSQLDLVINQNNQIIKEVCEEDSVEIKGSGVYYCGTVPEPYDFKGKGLLGLSDQIDELMDLNKIILFKTCETGSQPEIKGSYDFIDCEGKKEELIFKGQGIEGLKYQIDTIWKILSKIHEKTCDDGGCFPVLPDGRFDEFQIKRQLVLTFGENYPKQSGSLWHLSVPEPKDNLDWCRDFDNLIMTKGSVYARVMWASSKLSTSAWLNEVDDAKSFMQKLIALSKLQPTRPDDPIRITTGGRPRRQPKNRTIRCVRAVIADVDLQGHPYAVQCHLPPRQGC